MQSEPVFHYGDLGDICINGLDDKVILMESINPVRLSKPYLELNVIDYIPLHKGIGTATAYYSDKMGREFTPSFSHLSNQRSMVLQSTSKMLDRSIIVLPWLDKRRH